MQFSTLVLAGIVAAASAIATPVIEARTLQWCGSQRYDTNDYTCWEGYFLCPKPNGVIYYKCGDDCYSKSVYVCIDNKYLCPTTDPYRCGMACYNPNKYKCVGGNLMPK